jgi:small multidrug resistance family-3 protein
MNRATALLTLLIAAILEAGGDALVRQGLRANSSAVRATFFALGEAVLFGYGYIVNAPNWEFGRLLGLYVVFFFLVAQLSAWAIFHERPSQAVLVGGALIVAGGIVISLGSRQ